ncbi:MAG: type II secretion system F family protein [Phycisphaerales bacterium]|nr:MAG: type II secretion system F family protein [Phycisphaerales bacterium]
MSSRTTLSQAYFDLATMLDAGMPILRSLDIVVDGRKGYLKRVFSQIRETVGKGSSLAEALDQHPRVFPDLDRMLIEAAETSGSMGTSLKMLSEWHEFVHRLICQMIVALIYPFLILHIAAFVFPLPSLVLGEITTTEFLVAGLHILMYLWIPTGMVVVLILLRGRFPIVRLPLDFAVQRIPVLGMAAYHMAVCRYAKAFGMMYRAGVPITETVERANRATGNAIVARLFEGGKASVRAGGMAWEGFSKRLPSEYRQLWQIGEETGELDKTTAKIAEIAGDRADLYFTEFSKGLPKIIYFILLGVLAVMIVIIAKQYANNLSSF